jgi:hypothetical protein
MVKINLTPEQIKTLQLFSYYVQSHGAGEITIDLSLQDCNVEYVPDFGYGDNTRIDLYDSITELIEELSSLDDLYFDATCEDYGSLLWNIDCKERKVKVTLYENSLSSNEITNSLTFNDIPNNLLEHLEDFINTLPNNEINEYTIYFNGGGDSGYIDDFLNETNTPISNHVSDILYELLNNTLGGWEINEGSQGKFILHLDEEVIDLYVEENVSELMSLGTVLYFEF